MACRLHVVSKPDKQFLDDSVFAAERAKGKALWSGKKRGVARDQLLGQREVEAAKQARADERQAAEFTWSKPKPFRR
ncbi:hypothetical protein [Pantoea agglomerans]|uniref:hypothetical protein n=1 Tax=Enterobacter agglomerans TaxID=549 RepID=UPI00384E34D3